MLDNDGKSIRLAGWFLNLMPTLFFGKIPDDTIVKFSTEQRKIIYQGGMFIDVNRSHEQAIRSKFSAP